MTKELEKLKCKFCSVKVNRWKKTPSGITIDGFDTLKTHILMYHEEEARKIGMKW